jgi:nucleoside-diphosphate-sugar epimerase
MVERGGTVLVTGGTGFLGGWCIAELLSREYTVRTTVRDLRRADGLRASFAAAGERFLAVDRFLWMADVGQILRERLGPAAAKVPTRVAPNVLIRAMALFDPSVRSIVGDLGKSSTYTAEKAKRKLGWTPRPIEDSIADTAKSLLDRGLGGPSR